MIPRLSIFLIVAFMSLWAGFSRAQQAVISTPMHSINDSFFERIGVGFGFSGNGFFFNQGSFNSALPPFGGHDPNADSRFGFRAGNASFNFAFGQGNRRSHVMRSPSVTIPNGGTGTISDIIQRPFVTGITPVVGGGVVPIIVNTPYVPGVSGVQSISPVAQAVNRIRAGDLFPPSSNSATIDADATPNGERISGGDAGPTSSADHGDISVAEIRARQAVKRQSADEETAALIKRARGAATAGKTNVARIYYRMAIRRATDPQKQQLMDELSSLGE